MSQQAKSLVCKVCGLQLTSQQAILNHATQTGHTDFAESVEAVKEILCTTCGKKCQSAVEVEQHKRATGHTDFKDITNEDAAPVVLGAHGSTIPHPDDDETSKTVNATMYNQIVEMGFSAARAKHALLSGCTSVETAVAWLSERIDDAALDIEPENVTVTDAPQKAPLSEEEKRLKVEEMKRKLAEKRAEKQAQEQLLEIEKEKNRIASQKAAAEARAAAEEHKRKVAYEQMRREKEADRKAKEKVLIDMAVDKAVKAGKDATQARQDAIAEIERKHQAEEEARKKAHEEREAAIKAQETSSVSNAGSEWKLTSSDGPPQVAFYDTVNAAVRSLPTLPDTINQETLQSALTAITPEQRPGVLSILEKIYHSPLDGKLRKLKINNAAVGKALPTPACVNFMRLCGFRVDGEEFKMNTVFVRRIAVAVHMLQGAKST
eukprot:PhF_6_TR39070/c0_g1_i1/m.58470